MAIDTSLFINIVSQLKDKGIKDTQKGLRGLNGQTLGLNKSLGMLARRVAVFETLRRSFRAFVEDDAAARRLNTTLNNLGLAYSAMGAEKFIAQLEQQTGVLDDQLRPAFETLARVTGDFTQTQEILNTALNVAAGTGLDVVTVSKALSRAYAGNTTSISRLNTGLTKAELATGNFALIQDKLNSLFGGQAQAQLNTYQGQINLLKLGFNNAAEALGKGLVDGIKEFGGGDVRKAMGYIIGAGESLGRAFAGVAKFVRVTKDILTGNIDLSAEAQLANFNKLNQINDPARIRATARERRKAIEQENRAAARLARLRAKEIEAQKKAAAAAKKAELDKLKLQSAADIFEDEKIQLAAALKNKSLDESEILRLQLKQAIINENATRAEKLTLQLQSAEARVKELQGIQLKDPFEAWLTSLNAIDGLLKGITGATQVTTTGGGMGAPTVTTTTAAGVTSTTTTIPPTSNWFTGGGAPTENLPDGGTTTPATAAAAIVIAAESASSAASSVTETAAAITETATAIVNSGTSWEDLITSTESLVNTITQIPEIPFIPSPSGTSWEDMMSPTITINVSGTGQLSDDTKKAIVDTIIDASSQGFSTSGWYQTIGNVAL